MSITAEHRDAIASSYLEQLAFEPYPVQEEALLAWFTEEQGVLVCAPTGTGKTMIAEAAIYEALQLGKTAYYTTPLIALTDQKFHELQATVQKWGFPPTEVGLVTGNRKLNPQAKIQVVVAEILLNRLLHREAFDFSAVWAVVMDEFHSFNDPERGVVWEFGLALLPPSVKTLLLSATVGNALEFTNWLAHRHQRKLKLVSSDDRKVPLSFCWVDDQLLPELAEEMVRGNESARRTPALLFCFNREQCWTVAEQLKGKKVIEPGQQGRLAEQLEPFDWSQGAGPKLKQLLIRGIGVHHAGVLPRYRRIVESLFQQKLLTICVCTETLAAGINLPARSIILPSLLKGPPGKMKPIEPAAAHQMFGRAGRPQYDDQGFVYALAHEDDVKIARWQEKFDQIPADTKDPGLLKAKKRLKKKQPKRREGVPYWDQSHFTKLIEAPAANLASREFLPWRLLVYLLDVSPDVNLIRGLINKRLLQGKSLEKAQRQLDHSLMILWRAGYVELEPAPPKSPVRADSFGNQSGHDERGQQPADGASHRASSPAPGTSGLFSDALKQARATPAGGEVAKSSRRSAAAGQPTAGSSAPSGGPADPPREYRAEFAYPTDRMSDLLKLRGVHPLYALFLMNHLGIADRAERIQAMESLLELPRSLGKAVRVPQQSELPPGPLACERLDEQLLKLGLATAEELRESEEDEESQRGFYEERVYVLPLARKLQRLFEYDFTGVEDLKVTPCWVAGELLEFGGDFNQYVTSHGLQKQEGMIFRHLLRLVLLIDEFASLCPPEIAQQEWQDELGVIADTIEQSCREVDPQSTQQWLDLERGGDSLVESG